MKRLAWLIVGLLAALTVLYLWAEAAGLADETVFRQLLAAVNASAGGRWLAALTVVALLVADLALPVPSSVVMTLAGAFLGPWAGTAASFTGAMLSALAGFGLCRWLGQKAFARLIGSRDVARVSGWMDRHGPWIILLSRPVPMLTEVISCLAGLASMPAATFAVLSAAGVLPLSAVYAWAGSRAVAGDGLTAAVWVAVVLPAAGFAILRWVERRSDRAGRA